MKYKRRGTSFRQTESELYQRLFFTVSAIILTIAIVGVSLRFFGPKIGSFFGLISIHRGQEPKDDIPPPKPIFSSIPESTKDRSIRLNGIAEPGAIVKLFVNGPEKETTIADVDGLFTIVDIKLIEGNNKIFAKAEDQNGNVSEKSETVNVVLDTKKPKIEITEPANGAVIKNLNERISVMGTVSEKATVFVNGRFAVVKPNLTFEILIGANEGGMEITVEATDDAGNSSEEKIFITYEKSS